MTIKFDTTKINKSDLIDAVKTLNNLIDSVTFIKDEKLQKVKYADVKMEGIVRNFVEIVNLIPEEADLPENIVNMYQYIANECVIVEEVKIEERKPAADGKIYSTKEKVLFLENKIKEGKYTKNELIDLYMKEFGGSKSTPNYILWSGTRPDKNKLSGLIIVKNKEVVRFVKEVE